VRLIQLWGRGADNVDPGAVLQDIDYRFELAAGELGYVGRLDLSRPYVDDGGEARIALTVSDHRDEDVAAVAGSMSVADLPLPVRAIALAEGARGPLRYDPPWQWKMVMAPGWAWKPVVE
jgi:hypothetical protein